MDMTANAIACSSTSTYLETDRDLGSAKEPQNSERVGPAKLARADELRFIRAPYRTGARASKSRLCRCSPSRTPIIGM